MAKAVFEGVRDLIVDTAKVVAWAFYHVVGLIVFLAVLHAFGAL